MDHHAGQSQRPQQRHGWILCGGSKNLSLRTMSCEHATKKCTQPPSVPIVQAEKTYSRHIPVGRSTTWRIVRARSGAHPLSECGTDARTGWMGRDKSICHVPREAHPGNKMPHTGSSPMVSLPSITTNDCSQQAL